MTRLLVSLSIVATLATAPNAAAESLAEVSARIGAGVAVGGGAGRSTLRGSPVVVSIDGAYAIRETPAAWGFAGVVVETYDRTGVGLQGGLAISLGSQGKARVGARSIVRPYTLHGGLVGASWCRRAAPLRGCVDLEGDLYIAGTDLPERTAVAQVVLAVGVTFDVW